MNTELTKHRPHLTTSTTARRATRAEILGHQEKRKEDHRVRFTPGD